MLDEPSLLRYVECVSRTKRENYIPHHYSQIIQDLFQDYSRIDLGSNVVCGFIIIIIFCEGRRV